MKRKLGLIVNPIAGMGGRVGLKGSDGREILEKARKLGAKPESPGRAVDALKRLSYIKGNIEIVTYPCEMGEEEAKECGFTPTVIGSIEKGRTTSQDTKSAAKEMLREKIEILLFAGGDGTARDVCSAIGEKIPALGIPAGVKIHSAAFGTNPKNAGDLAAKYLAGKTSGFRLREAEVMDIDEQAFRENRLSARLYGYLKVPYERRLVQDAKAASSSGEEESMGAIACDVVENMEADCLYIIGPGTTTGVITNKLGLTNTLLGVDAIYNKKTIDLDLSESRLLKIISEKKAKIVVSVIGRQGYIFGRGNQQISAEVIRKIGKGNIIVVATKNKLMSLGGSPLLVDTGDSQLDKILRGYVQIVTGLRERIVLKVAS